MRADQRDHSKQKEGPDGKWPARKRLGSSTKKARRRNARKLLGKLPNAVVITASSTSVVARSRAAWSSVHQDGGRAGKGAVIPRRQFLWISDELLQTAADVVADHVVEVF
jgi:phage gpG-like protein